ncbi:MAG: EamA family transporter [Pseudomonadota bacterium]
MSMGSGARAGGADLRVEWALLALLALLWGSSYLFLKIAVTELPPLTLIALRVSGAAAFLLLVMALRGERLPRRRADWGLLFVQSLLNATLAWTLLAWGQRHVEAGLASVLNSTSPIFVFLFTALITRHEPAPPRKLLGALLGLTGVGLIVGLDALEGLGRGVLAQLACLASAMLYAAAAIWGRRFGHLSATATAAGTMLCAAGALVPAALLLEAPWRLSPSAAALGAAAALSILCTGVALLIYFRLVRTLGSLGVASQAYLRAGVGVALGMVVLGEAFSAVTGLGLIAAMLGVALINWPARRAG